MKNRERFITDFYACWIIANPTKHVYNKSLKSFIEVKFIILQETASKAAMRYKSTLAVVFLTEIMENAIIKGKPQEPKKDNAKTVCSNARNGIRKARFRENKTHRRRVAWKRAKDTVLHYGNRKRLLNPRGIA